MTNLGFRSLPLQHPQLFLLRLLDQFLADHHVRRGTMKTMVEAQAIEITKIARCQRQRAW